MRAFVFQVIFKTASCLTSNFLWKLTKLTKIFFLHCTLYNVLRSELEPESLWDLGHLEPELEQLKKVAAP